jgi:hypothetical protein
MNTVRYQGIDAIQTGEEIERGRRMRQQRWSWAKQVSGEDEVIGVVELMGAGERHTLLKGEVESNF